MTVARVSIARIAALLALPSLPLADGCQTDDGIVQDTLEGGMAGECGNGMIEADEACDDENDDPRDDCTNECQAAVCGDGVAGAGEACDDADDDDEDSCTVGCARGPAAVAAVATGDAHVCALSDAGVVRCWGAPEYGRLGHPGYNDYDDYVGDDEPPSDWAPVVVADDVVDLVAGSNHTCALRSGGEVRCWGGASSGQLGYGNTSNIGDDEDPADAGDVPLPGLVTNLAGGSSHTCAVFEDGRVACWGYNSSGQLGIGTTSTIGDDETVDPATGFVSLPGPAVEVAAGNDHSCARLESGDVVCWGRQAEGQLGNGQPDPIGDDEAADAAGTVVLGGAAIDIDTKVNHTCAVLDGGGVRCWGSNSSGQLGNGDVDLNNVGDRKTPAEDGVVTLDEGEVAVAVEAGSSHTCAVLLNGNVRCWGNDTANGVPSDTYGNSVEPFAPARIGVPVKELFASYSYNCAILDSAAVRCWGSNTGSVLGNPMISSSETVKDPSLIEDVDVF